MKITIEFTLAARYLLGRKLRTFLTTLAVIFGVLVLFSLNIALTALLSARQAAQLEIVRTLRYE